MTAGEPSVRNVRPTGTMGPVPESSDDPVLVQRARMASLAKLGKRIGYFALLVSCFAFVVGALSDLPRWSVALVIAGLALATSTLVPAIILGYAVAKAEREDPGPSARRSSAVRG